MCKIFFCFYFCFILFQISLFAQNINNEDGKSNYLNKDSLQIEIMHDRAYEIEDSLEAFTLQEKAKIICEKINNKKLLIRNVILEAALYHFHSDQEKAITVNKEAEQLCIKNNLPEQLISIYINAGIYYGELGDRKKEIENYYKALEFAEKLKKDFLIAKCKSFIAMASYMGLENTEAEFKFAVDQMLQAIALYEKKEKWSEMAKAYNNLGIIYQKHSNFKDAIVAYEKAIAIATEKATFFQQLQEKTTVANAQTSMAGLLQKNQKYDLAQQYAKKAIPILLEYKDLRPLGECYLYVALASTNKNNFSEAKIYLDSSIKIAIETNDADAIMNNWEAQYKLDSAQNNTFAALKSFKIFTRIKDSLFSLENMTSIKRLNLQFETEKKDIEIVEQKKQLKQQWWLIGLASLLALMALLVGYFIYRGKKLNQNLFVQKEKALVLEKNNAIIAKQLEEGARKKAELERQLEQDEKEKSFLREELKAEENMRLQNDINFKHKELATVTLNIQQKNSLLETLREHLYSLSEKKGADKDEAIKNMRRSIKSNINFDKDWDKVKIHFENVHTGFFDKLSALGSSLTPNELKQCAYIKINMNPKEVGNLLGIDAQSVRMSRYRIKKKIGLAEDTDLSEFIMNL